MFCKHKYGKVEDGYQYCTKCGTAREVGCNHQWERIGEMKRKALWSSSGFSEITFVLQCKKCGDIKRKNVS